MNIYLSKCALAQHFVKHKVFQGDANWDFHQVMVRCGRLHFRVTQDQCCLFFQLRLLKLQLGNQIILVLMYLCRNFFQVTLNLVYWYSCQVKLTHGSCFFNITLDPGSYFVKFTLDPESCFIEVTLDLLILSFPFRLVLFNFSFQAKLLPSNQLLQFPFDFGGKFLQVTLSLLYLGFNFFQVTFDPGCCLVKVTSDPGCCLIKFTLYPG